MAAQLRELLDGIVSHGTALAPLGDMAFSFTRTNEEKVEALLAWLHERGSFRAATQTQWGQYEQTVLSGCGGPLPHPVALLRRQGAPRGLQRRSR